MQKVTIIPLPLGPFQVNTYLVICRTTGACVIIDPAGDPDTIMAALDREKATPLLILNTHGHPDHVLANAALQSSLGVPTAMHGADSGLYADSPEVAALERQTGLIVETRADRSIVDGETIPMGSASIQVRHTPGHTPGSCCFLVDGNLFTGDTLFVGDVGRTDLKGGSLDRLIRSIADQLMGLPDDTCIWPGHDYHLDGPSDRTRRVPATLGREKRENPYITDFILDGEDA